MMERELFLFGLIQKDKKSRICKSWSQFDPLDLTQVRLDGILLLEFVWELNCNVHNRGVRTVEVQI